MRTNHSGVKRHLMTRAICMSSAIAMIISSTAMANTPITINFAAGSSEATGATASVLFDFEVGLGDDFLILSILNTTSPDIGSTLTAVGFEWPTALPNLPEFADDGAGFYFDEIDYNVGVSPGRLDAPDGYDVMITSDNNFLGGRPLGGTMAGESTTLRLALGDTSLDHAQFETIWQDHLSSAIGPVAIVRFQSVGPDGALSNAVVGEVAGDHTPEPASALLLALGGTVLLARRRR